MSEATSGGSRRRRDLPPHVASLMRATLLFLFVSFPSPLPLFSVLPFPSPFPFPPNEGERSAETARRCLRGTGRARHDAARPGTLAKGARAPLRSGTRASRRSTVAFSGSGPRFLFPEFPPGQSSELLAARFLVPGGRVPRAIRAGGYESPAADATPGSAFRTSPETPLVSRDARYIQRLTIQSRFIDGIIYRDCRTGWNCRVGKGAAKGTALAKRRQKRRAHASISRHAR